MRHAVDPLADRLVEFGLACAKHIGHGGNTALHLGLCGQKRRHALLGIDSRLPVSPPAKDCRDTGKKQDNDGAEQAHAERDCVGAKNEKRLIERENCWFHRRSVGGFEFVD